jgi:hypothetical protein
MVADRLFMGDGRMGEYRMLAISDNGFAWLSRVCTAVKDGDYLNDQEVRKLFHNAAVHARAKKIPFDEGIDHVAEFIRTRNEPGVEPVIPDFLRAFCEPCFIELAKSRSAALSSVLSTTQTPEGKAKPHHAAKVKKLIKGGPLRRESVASRR